MPDDRFRAVIEEYKEEMFGCDQTSVSSGPLVSCGSIPLADIELRWDLKLGTQKGYSGLNKYSRLLTFF